MIVASAPYATPVLNGTPLVSPFEAPRTSLWFWVYGQVVQADGASMRNILLATSPGTFINPGNIDVADKMAQLLKDWQKSTPQRDRIGVGGVYPGGARHTPEGYSPARRDLTQCPGGRVPAHGPGPRVQDLVTMESPSLEFLRGGICGPPSSFRSDRFADRGESH